MAIALDWRVEVASEAGKAVNYFSGRGDVKVKRCSQLGFLLNLDISAEAYLARARNYTVNRLVLSLFKEVDKG